MLVSTSPRVYMNNISISTQFVHASSSKNVIYTWVFHIRQSDFLENVQVSNIWGKQLKHDLDISVNTSTTKQNPGSSATHPADPEEKRERFGLEKDAGKVKKKNWAHYP